MYSLPSTSKIRAPLPRAMKRGVSPTDPNARTGLLTPPGISLRARSKSLRERVVFTRTEHTARFPPLLAFALRLLRLGQLRHRDQLLARLEVHEAHALRRAAHRRDAGDARAQHLAAVGDEHDLVVVDHLRDAHDLP